MTYETKTLFNEITRKTKFKELDPVEWAQLLHRYKAEAYPQTSFREFARELNKDLNYPLTSLFFDMSFIKFNSEDLIIVEKAGLKTKFHDILKRHGSKSRTEILRLVNFSNHKIIDLKVSLEKIMVFYRKHTPTSQAEANKLKMLSAVLLDCARRL